MARFIFAQHPGAEVFVEYDAATLAITAIGASNDSAAAVVADAKSVDSVTVPARSEETKSVVLALQLMGRDEDGLLMLPFAVETRDGVR